MTKFNLSEDYLNKCSDTVAATPHEHLPVRYAITCRRGGMMCGVADIVDLLNDHCNGPLTLWKADGERRRRGRWCWRGRSASWYRWRRSAGILSLSAAAANMAELVEAAGDSIRIIDTAARRYPPELIGPAAIAAAVGSSRTNTQAGQTAVLSCSG